MIRCRLIIIEVNMTILILHLRRERGLKATTMNIIVQRDPFLMSMNTETGAEKWFHLGWLFFQRDMVCKFDIPSMLEICCAYGASLRLVCYVLRV